jgi:hypothetical protein
MKTLLLFYMSAVSVAFSAGLTDLSYIVINGNVTITDCDTSATGSLSIPATIEDFPVTAIGASAFRDCSKLTNIILPSSLTTIEAWAFNSCFDLTEITIPAGVLTIERSIFYKCIDLKTIRFESQIAPSISGATFSGSKVEIIIYPYNATGYGDTFGGVASFEGTPPIMDNFLETYPTATAYLDSDDDKDGRSLLMEYALNSDPIQSQDSASLPFQIIDFSESQYFSVTYRKAQLGVVYTVESSGDLLTWNTDEVIEIEPGDINSDTTTGVPVGRNTRFIRLKVRIE